MSGSGIDGAGVADIHVFGTPITGELAPASGFHVGALLLATKMEGHPRFCQANKVRVQVRKIAGST